MYLGRFLFHQKNSNLPHLHTTSETIWAIAPLQPIMGSDSCRKVFVSMWHDGTGLRFESRTSHACFGHRPWNLWSRIYVSGATNLWDLKKTQVLILGEKMLVLYMKAFDRVAPRIWRLNWTNVAAWRDLCLPVCMFFVCDIIPAQSAASV